MIKLYTLLAAIFACILLNGQCINTYPYLQDFETSQGGWTTGGTNNDWAWGAPAKSVITAAGSGSKCWVSGGLTGNFYKYSEASYVESPCFDFTNVKHPFIQFLIFWESENKYDGTNLQYSLNGGTTWTNLGAFGDPVNCLNNNWFNEATVKYLQGLASPTSGWGGNVQTVSGNCQGGGGLGKWVTASHCMAQLAGQANVTFRFTFGAGTTCNDFNGVAFDSVAIGEAPANAGTISYTCGNFNTITFTGNPVLCPDTFLWNFGDAGSGTTDTASTLNSAHVFSAPGSYNVSLTLSGPCNAPATITQTVRVLDVTATPTNGSCGTSGSIQLAVSGGTGPFTYSWSGGLTGQNPANVTAGSYNVTVTAAQSCPATAQATVSQSSGSFTASVTPANASCGINNGSATASATSGGGSYTYVWSNNTSGQTISGLAAGAYQVTVVGSAGCTATASTTISTSANISANVTTTPAGCTTAGSATATGTGGSSSYSYLWSSGATTQTASGLSAGSYTVTVSNSGCSVTAMALVGTTGTGIALSPSSNAASCGSSNGTATVTVTTGMGPFTYHWNNNSAASTINNVAAGTYTITVSGSGSCSATASVVVASAGGLTLAASVTPTSCNENNGAASINVTLGPGPYVYNWSNSGNTASISNVAAGLYTITVTGSGGCSASSQINVSSSVGLVATISNTSATCGNSNGSLTATVVVGNSPYTYNWSTGATAAVLNNLIAGAYMVTVKDASGCSDTLSGVVSSTNGISVTASTNKTIMCSGDTAAVCANGTYASYSWSTGDTTQCINTPYPGNYYLTVTDINNCTAASNHVSVSNYTPTPVTISVDGDTLTSYNADSYQWYFNNQPIPGDTQRVIIATQAGIYSVKVSDNNGCYYQSSPTEIDVTGISYINTHAAINVFPNPLSSGNWHVEVSDGWLGGWIEVYDVTGQIIYRAEIQNTSSELPMHVSDGVYLLRISTENKSAAVRLIKL